jgi:hypothetical protein
MLVTRWELLYSQRKYLKMRQFNYFILTLFVLVFVPSCTEIDQNVEKNQIQCGFGLSINEMKEIGINHNIWLTYVRNQVNYSAPNLTDELASKMNLIPNNLSNNQKDQVVQMYQTCFNSNNNLASKITNSYTLSLYNEILNQLELSNNILDLNQRLDNLSEIVINTTTCMDKEALIVGIEVCRNSALLWFPREMGGMELVKDIGSRWDWRKFVRNDVAGATWAVFELGGAIALGGVPGTNAAIGGAIASAAVGGSLMGELFK